ncbi:MAG: hypothetical protein JRI55_29835 [Deltaproteobacteria bacterium]|jgi:hypothetical protein|nr:hypothetical protein [Deltaproteobacteria bacterium]
MDHSSSLRTPTLALWLVLLVACSDADDASPSTTAGTGGQVPTTTTTTSTTGGTGGIGGTSGDGGAGGGAPCVPGEATFSWTAPNQNTDGTCLTDLAAYALLYGAESGNYTHRTEVPLDSASCSDTADENECGFVQECTVTIVGLEPQLWYFVMIAIDGEGNESDYSNEVSKDLSCPDG